MFRYDKDIERIMQKKKRDIINELTAYGNKILQELSGVDKQTLTRLRQVLNDYNNIQIDIEKHVNVLKPLIDETTTLRDSFKNDIDIIHKMDNFIVPENFGAIGDSETDDTVALQLAINESSELGIPLYFPQGKIYRVSAPLNFYNGEYKDVVLCMEGFNPKNFHTYTCKNYGGIKLDNGVSLFKNATIKGSINRMCIIGVRDESVHFFDKCTIKTLCMSDNIIANFGAIFYDSSINATSHITHNIMLSCFYFAQNVDTGSACIDSHIEYNYINGGEEPTDNACFEWSYFNGSNISNNFIDYYKVMYRPKSITPSAFEGPVSMNNQYQVFRYFYLFKTNVLNSFLSIGDCFNWNDETKEAIKDVMSGYTKETYKGDDNQTYEIPNYIARPYETGQITIQNAKIGGNISNLLYIDMTPVNYNYCHFKCSFTGITKYNNKISYKQGATKPLYNAGGINYNTWDIDLIEPVETLPVLAIGYSSRYNGCKVLYKNTICTATNVYDRNNDTWLAKWLDPQGTEVT